MRPLFTEDLENIYTDVGSLWENLRDQRLFLTGGTGFFGCWLLESLIYAIDHLNLGCEAIVLSRYPEQFATKCPHIYGHPSIKFIKGDITNFGFPVGNFSHIIHAATSTKTTDYRTDPLGMLDTIVQGTRHTLDFAVSAGVKRFLLTSSGAIYGNQPVDMSHIPEDYQGSPDPLDEGSIYGEGKRLAELLCSIYARQYAFEVKIARCFSFVGPHLPLDEHFAIGNFIQDILKGENVEIKGSGNPLRSYLYASDLTTWLWSILFKGQSLQAYNVGSDLPISIQSLSNLVSAVSDGNTQMHFDYQSVSLHNKYIPSIHKVIELGQQVRVDLKPAIDKTYSWYKS